MKAIVSRCHSGVLLLAGGLLGGLAGVVASLVWQGLRGPRDTWDTIVLLGFTINGAIAGWVLSLCLLLARAWQARSRESRPASVGVWLLAGSISGALVGALASVVWRSSEMAPGHAPVNLDDGWFLIVLPGLAITGLLGGALLSLILNFFVRSGYRS